MHIFNISIQVLFFQSKIKCLKSQSQLTSSEEREKDVAALMTEVEEVVGESFSDVTHLFQNFKAIEEVVGDALRLQISIEVIY